MKFDKFFHGLLENESYFGHIWSGEWFHLL
jgi:hypothetical protein